MAIFDEGPKKVAEARAVVASIGVALFVIFGTVMLAYGAYRLIS